MASPTFALFAAASLSAQGVTTGAISGTVANEQGAGLGSVQVQITNRSSGYSTGTTTRDNGFYFVQGLEVGGPYTVRVRRIGFEPQETNDVVVNLSRTTKLDFTMKAAAQQLASVVTTASANAAEFSPTRQGVATVVLDTLLRRVPTLQRDVMDLVKLTPQVVPGSSTGGGPSAGGGYNRLNNFTVDGANQNDRFNLGSTGGQPGGSTGGRVMSQEAVKEFQVLLSPTDVRYGNFAGMMINAVTKSGTNQFDGGGTYTFRTPYMAANKDQIRSSGFQIKQFGFHIGGPIIQDKLHFFLAPEWQDRTDPTTGTTFDSCAGVITPCTPSVGSATTRVALDSIDAIRNFLGGTPGFGSAAAVGHADAFRRGNPLLNIMGRLDWSINESNRAVFRVLDNTAEQDEFTRNTGSLAGNVTQQSSGIRLTSNSFTREAKNRSLAAQLFTNLSNGMSNEFLFGYNTVGDKRFVPVTAPEISVGVTPIGGNTPSVAVTAGTERFSPGNDLQQKILEVSNNFTIPFASHTVTVGGRYEHTDIYNFFLSGAGNGAWRFTNIATLLAGTPQGYAFSYANGGDIAAKFKGSQISAYAQDLWNLTPRLSVTAGVRMDMPKFLDTPVQNDSITVHAPAMSVTHDGRTVDLAEIRTDRVPKTQALFSPRVGINWDVTGRQTTQVRANAGIFTGNTPYILVGNAFSNTGLGGVTVACTGAGVPVFSTDVSALPKACAGQAAPQPGVAGTIGINVTDPNFKYPQNFTGTFGVDHWLPWNIIGTFEFLYRKEINALYVRDLNLAGPRIVGGNAYRDPFGRVLYADTIFTAANGSITSTRLNQTRIDTTGPAASRVAFSEGAIELTNAKAGHNYTLTGQLRKRFSRAFEITGAYTYMQSKDVQSLTSDRAISNWRFGRQFSGFEYDPEDAQVSNFQRPHRLITYGTWTAPWRKNQTDLTFYFEAISGISMTYVTNNDINGDGIGGNDPIYVPRNPADPAEFRIGNGAGTAFALDPAAAATFDRFIELQPCLDAQRGSIMKRNSCQGPMLRRMDLSIRQSLTTLRAQNVTLQWDVFNFANFINHRWGQARFPVGGTFNNQTALNTAALQPGPLGSALWSYNMNTALLNNVRANDSPWALNPNSTGNNYQMQLTMRYAF
ncbi:MAG: carboxypeptidase regulatory-like domain-containing protein [Gemmatimonadaceae bacterium]